MRLCGRRGGRFFRRIGFGCDPFLGGEDFFGAVLERCAGECPFLGLVKDGESSFEDDRWGGVGVVEDRFESGEGLGGHVLETVTDGHGVFLVGVAIGFVEVGIFEPGVDGGARDVGELGSRGYGGAYGKGMNHRDLSRCQLRHGAAVII